MDSRFDAYDLARDAVREAGRRSQQERDNPKPPPAPLAFIDPTELHGLPIPERQWVVPGWLPSAAVTLHYAAGGEGKTLLAQMLMTSAATGTPWLGLPVTQCRAMGLFCEDDADEMHRRQDAICRAYGAELRDLAEMRWSCPVGDDNTLIRFEPDGTPVMTDRFADFVAQAKAFAPGLVVLDVAADLFGGNENVRQQVSTFLKFCLGGLARDLGAAVLLNAHPSRAGIASGDLDGGSTGWNGGARSRWALVTPREEGEPVDETARVLTKRKANYSTRGDEIRLRFRDGVLEREGGLGSGIVASMERRNCEAVFLELLDKIIPSGRHASDSRNSAAYAPKLFCLHPDRQGFTKRDFEMAMNRLFAAGLIRVEHYGKPSDRTHHIARATPGEGPEEGGEGGGEG
jgi:RecA-family ATPase